MTNIIHLLLLSVLFGSNVVSAQIFISSNSSAVASTFSAESSSSSIIPTSSSSSPSSNTLTSPSSSTLTSSSSSVPTSTSEGTILFSSIFVAPSNTSSSFNLFSTSINTNVSSTSSFLEASLNTSTPTTHNISTLPATSTSKRSITSSSIESRSSTSFRSTSSGTPTTSASLSTYTSDGQVLVTQVFMTLTSTQTSFSTKPGKHHGLSSKNKKIVAGVVVGVGVPFIILIIWLIYFFMLKGKKQRYIDSQGREVIDIKHNKVVRYIWCDLLGFSFKDAPDKSMYSNSSFRNSNNLNRGGSKNSSHMNNLGVLGTNVMQMNDIRLEKENALLKEQREKGFPTSTSIDDKEHMDSSNSPGSLQDQSGRNIDGNFKGRNSLNTHRRMESVVTGDGFDYLDEINAKKY